MTICSNPCPRRAQQSFSSFQSGCHKISKSSLVGGGWVFQKAGAAQGFGLGSSCYPAVGQAISSTGISMELRDLV